MPSAQVTHANILYLMRVMNFSCRINMRTTIFALIGASLAASAASAAPKVPAYVIDYGKRSMGFMFFSALV